MKIKSCDVCEICHWIGVFAVHKVQRLIADSWFDFEIYYVRADDDVHDGDYVNVMKSAKNAAIKCQ